MTATARGPANVPGPRPRARRGEGSKLRELILDAAERLLVRYGDADAVSIRGIAEAVGVTPPSIYLHFTDKEALIRAVSERSFAEFDDAVEGAGAGVSDPLEALRARAHAYVRFGLENPEQYRVLFMSKTGTHGPEVDFAAMPGSDAFQHVVDAVGRAIDSGALRGDVDPFLTATGLWACVHGVTSLMISLPEFPWPDVDALVDHICGSQLSGLVAKEKTR
ncbi:MAG TPA: TetR/AcrR family transcriptional regulator [Acidimicrobiia bacterium]